MNNRLQVLLWIAVISILWKSVNALDIASAQDGSCDNLQNVTQADADMNWLLSVRNWFMVGGSKHHLYRLTGYHLPEEDLEDVPEYRFYYDSCFTLNTNFTTGVATLNGYASPRQSTYSLALTPEGAVDFAVTSTNSSIGETRQFLTLTDNESWALFTNCELNSNTKSWNVASTLPTLDAQSMGRIVEHVTAQGFSPGNFAFMRYDTCDISSVSRSSATPTTPTTAPPSTTTASQPTTTTSPPTTVPIPTIPWAPQLDNNWLGDKLGGKSFGLAKLFNKDFGKQNGGSWLESHFAKKLGNGGQNGVLFGGGQQNKLFGGFHSNKWAQKQNGFGGGLFGDKWQGKQNKGLGGGLFGDKWLGKQNKFGGGIGGPVGNNWFGNAQFQQLPNGTWFVGGVSANGTWIGGAFHPNGTWIGGVPQNGFPLWNQG